MQNLAQQYKAITLLSPQTVTVDIAGVSGVDVQRYNDDAMVVLQTGTCSGAGTTCDVSIETSINGGVSYSEALAFTTLNQNADSGIAAARINLRKVTHIRAAVDVTGGAPSYPLSIVLLALAERQGSSLNTVSVDES